MLSLAILGLIMDEPLHGYEIRLRLQKLLGISGLISFGSLYPTLAKLNHQGFVSVEIVTPEIAPSSKPKLTERKNVKFIRLNRKQVLNNRLEIAPATKNRLLKRWQEVEVSYIQSQLKFLETLNIGPDQ